MIAPPAPSTVEQHYEGLLADHYTRMFGDFETRAAADQALLGRLGIAARPGADQAVDLGCGSGFQALALARLGFRVTAIDLSAKLLAELEARRGALPVRAVRGDMRTVAGLAPPGSAVAVCMGDSLAHLERRADVDQLLAGCAACLRPGGRLVLGFRDQTIALTGLDRILPVRATDDLVMTCLLDYEAEAITVQDLIHVREAGEWTFRKGAYRKLRLTPGWVRGRVEAAGLRPVHEEESRGLVTLVAELPVAPPPRPAPAVA